MQADKAGVIVLSGTFRTCGVELAAVGVPQGLQAAADDGIHWVCTFTPIHS